MLDALFSPKAIAVIGASNRPLTIGYRITQNLAERGLGENRKRGFSL